MIFYLTFLLLLVGATFAQHEAQPAKVDTTDTRSGMVLFELEDKSNKNVIQLQRSVTHNHYLKSNEEQLKLSTTEAKKLEMDFASRFLKCQYEIEEIPGECQSDYRLTLKGDVQEICRKDEKKGQEIKALYESLKKRFE